MVVTRCIYRRRLISTYPLHHVYQAKSTRMQYVLSSDRYSALLHAAECVLSPNLESVRVRLKYACCTQNCYAGYPKQDFPTSSMKARATPLPDRDKTFTLQRDDGLTYIFSSAEDIRGPSRAQLVRCVGIRRVIVTPKMLISRLVSMFDWHNVQTKLTSIGVPKAQHQ